MWRRFGDVAFGALIGVAITLEVVPLAVLTWVLVRRAADELAAPDLQTTLVGAIASTGLGLVLVTAYVLAYQVVSDGRERLFRERREAWVARWLAILFQGGPPPAPPLDRPAAEALLEIREVLRGTEGEEVSQLIRRYGVADALRRRAGGGSVSQRLEALEGLARARLPETLPDAVALMGDPEPALRVAAARTAARILAEIPPGPRREEGGEAFARALEANRLPAGVVEEVLLLVDEAAPSVVSHLVRGPGATEASIRAGLEVAGRFKLLDFLDAAAAFVGHADPEVRAAALRALARMAYVPAAAEGAVLEAVRDPVGFVRVNACRAVRSVRPEAALPALWERLSDPSWWVRRAAAESMAAMGAAGAASLRRAAREHPDRYGRDMAAQVLRDAGLEEVA
ncbi:MAG TPA: HEAT repeat domain-containing protein [Actinomycetota bacterium]|nr:HEAT repeat domain-containing protein [Actinomycetota bacterium]